MDVHALLSATHILGAVLGAGGAVFAEIFLLKSLRDGEVDPTESSFMKAAYAVIRAGLAILILSGFGFLLLFRLSGNEEALLSPVLWAKLSIVIVILVNAVLLQTRRIPLAAGSALSLSSWLAATVLRPLDPSGSYVALMFGYVVSVAIVWIALHIIRRALGVRFPDES